MKFKNWCKETIRKPRRLHIANKLIEVAFEYTNERVLYSVITVIVAIAFGFAVAYSLYS